MADTGVSFPLKGVRRPDAGQGKLNATTGIHNRLGNLKQENPMNVNHYIGFDVHKKWDIYFTQVAPICWGCSRQSLRSTSPCPCTGTVPPLRLARRVARRVFLGFANSVG